MAFEIKHDETDKRFYANIDGQISELKYKKIDDQTLDYYSTFVPESLRNQGIAKKLVEYALEYAKEKKYQIIPSCPYVSSFIQNYPKYADMIKQR